MPLNRPRGIADADSNPSAAVPIGALYARTFAGNSCARITAISRLFEPQSARSRRARMRRESACERIRSRYRRGKEKALGQSVVARDRRQRDGNVEMSRMSRDPRAGIRAANQIAMSAIASQLQHPQTRSSKRSRGALNSRRATSGIFPRKRATRKPSPFVRWSQRIASARSRSATSLEIAKEIRQ